MLAEQRARAILQQLSQHQTVSVTELCQATGASEATIRRDLNALARQGKLVKIHGGATSLEEEEFLAREPDRFRSCQTCGTAYYRPRPDENGFYLDKTLS
jgi:DeoR family fructose operon transcriptional repressor